MSDKPDRFEDEHEWVRHDGRMRLIVPPQPPDRRWVYHERTVMPEKPGRQIEPDPSGGWRYREHPIVWPVGAAIPIEDEEKRAACSNEIPLRPSASEIRRRTPERFRDGR